ncbi:MAG TPA: glycosyltransferase [Candidatus Sulfomarinibacteraceae bacterium]|nr:glycosyltransferase [Candidatus Sulfomarinibacteraceae bacterium]
MPLRILIVARWYPSHEVPGRGTFVADQAAALAAAGAEVAVICPEPVHAEGLDGPARAERLARVERWAAVVGARLAFAAPIGRGAARVPVLRIPAPLPAGGEATRDPVELAALEAVTLVPVGTALRAAWPFDAIHAHTGLPDGLAAAALAEAVGVPLLTTEHDSSTPDRLAEPAAAAAYRSLLGARRAVVAVSRTLASRIEERLGPEAGGIDVVPNVLPIDTFAIRPDDERDPDELLWVGARKASKGTDTLLRAFALVHRHRPALRLRLIGRAASVAEEDRLVALAAELGVAASVRFEPPADRAGVAAAMARATLFVHPSPWETFGIVAAEALAMGLPVAATPSGGVAEILGNDGRFGTIARDHEPASLAAAITDALGRRAAFDPAALRAHVAGRYAPDVVAADLIARFEGLGAAARSGGPTLPAVDPAALPRAVVIVGFRRASAVARVPVLPPGLAAGLSVVTAAPVHPISGQPAGDPTPPLTVRAWVDVDPGAGFRARLAELGGAPPRSRGRWWTLLHPLDAIRRRRLWAAQPAIFAEARQRAVRAAIDGDQKSAATRGRPVTVLPLDADDLEWIEPFLGAGDAELAPGTLGWLADRWASAER